MLSIWADQVQPEMDVLVPFDSLLSAADWATKWAEVLQHAESMADLVRKVQEKVKVQPEGDSEVSKAAGASAYMQLRKTNEAEGLEQSKPDALATANGGKTTKPGYAAVYGFSLAQVTKSHFSLLQPVLNRIDVLR